MLSDFHSHPQQLATLGGIERQFSSAGENNQQSPETALNTSRSTLSFFIVVICSFFVTLKFQLQNKEILVKNADFEIYTSLDGPICSLLNEL